MSKTLTTLAFAILGIATWFGIFFLLDLLPWRFDVDGIAVDLLYFGLALNVAIVAFVASLCGALVARINFIGPAAIFGFLAWGLAVSFARAVSDPSSWDGVVPYTAAVAGGLVISVGGSIFGALLGGRYSKPIKDNASDAA